MMAPNNIASTTEAVLGSTRISITPDKSSTSSSKHDKNSKNLRPTSSNGDVILLESPDLVLDSNSRFNCSTIKTYLECSGPWRFLFSNRRQVKWFSYYIHYSFSYAKIIFNIFLWIHHETFDISFRTSLMEHLTCLFLLIALCLFVAFIVWFVIVFLHDASYPPKYR